MRCINLDWLEVYALEPIEQGLNAEYFRAKGWHVEERDYGTRIYEEMFTLYDHETDYKLLEIRRHPKQKDGAILPLNAVHIRLTNRTCYYDNAAKILKDFMQMYNYEFVRISRVDICLDFERFDFGDDPQKFIYRYMKGKYSKINQANIHAHGDDNWNQREWYSLSWGSIKSAIGTKLYLKTKELKEVSDKPYIRYSWFLCGLVDNPNTLQKRKADGQIYEPDIWRLEFSIRSDVRGWFVYEKDGDFRQKRSIKNTLEMYMGKPALIAIFNSLQEHYFHFRKYDSAKTKYQCERKVLFDFGTDEEIMKIQHPSSDLKPVSFDMRLLKYLQTYLNKITGKEERDACNKLIEYISNTDQSRILENPYSKIQLQALQMAIAEKMAGSEEDVTCIIKNIINKLNINEIF